MFVTLLDKNKWRNELDSLSLFYFSYLILAIIRYTSICLDEGYYLHRYFKKTVGLSMILILSMTIILPAIIWTTVILFGSNATGLTYHLQYFAANRTVVVLQDIENRHEQTKSIVHVTVICFQFIQFFVTILFYSKISPLKPGRKLNNENIHNISKYSKLVLNLAIKYGGSSIRDFKNSKGVSGSFQNEFKVYDREKKNCPRRNCRSKISKIFISNRSTFFCKSCQK